ncbi:MAG: hypothetical protein LIO68_05765 [Rikenellaceae bacterium]|nr:hypothetical protein [Rikenellaceae bacterium]
MKTLITFIAAILTVVTAAAQDYYKDGALIKINDDLTFKCGANEDFISLTNVKKRSVYAPQKSAGAALTDRSVIKRALEETFTAEELEKYKDVMLSFDAVLNASVKPVDVAFAFQNGDPGNTIPPAKFAKLRQKIMEYAQFRTNIKLNPGEYYYWDEGLVAPIWYYRDAKYIQRGKK